MTYQICPICDQKLTKPHYCSFCKQRIKHPLTIDVDYYLNERHPEGEHDCTYHDSHDAAPAQSASSEDWNAWPWTSTTRQGSSRTKSGSSSRPSASSARPQSTSRPAQSPARPQRQTASRSSGSSGKTKKKSSKMPIFILVLLIAAACWLLSFYQAVKAVLQEKGGLSFWSSIASEFGLEGTPLDSLITDGLSSWEITPESGYDVPPAFAYGEDDYISWSVETDEIIAAGKPCSGYGHFLQDAESLIKALLSYTDSIGAELSDSYDYSDNTEDSSGYTFYDTVQTYDFGSNETASYDNGFQISSDTATGQLHSVSLQWDDAGTAADLLTIIVASLQNSGDWTLDTGDTDLWLQDVRRNLPDAEYGQLAPDSVEESGISISGGVVYSGQTPMYTIFIYTWNN